MSDAPRAIGETLALAEQLEWSAEAGGVPAVCPGCAYTEAEGHDAACPMARLLAALRAAREPDRDAVVECACPGGVHVERKRPGFVPLPFDPTARGISAGPADSPQTLALSDQEWAAIGAPDAATQALIAAAVAWRRALPRVVPGNRLLCAAVDAWLEAHKDSGR